MLVETAIILAVGHPNHQSQLAFNQPRAMLPVLGKPLVLRLLELLYSTGIRHYVVVVGENEGAVASYLHTRLPEARIQFALQPGSSSLTRTLATAARQLGQPFLLASYRTFVHPRFPERLLKRAQDFPGELVLSGAPTTLSKSPTSHIGIVEDQRITGIIAQPPDHEHNLYRLIDLAVCGENFVRYLSGLVMNTGLFNNQFLDMARLYLQTGANVFLAETAWSLPVETDEDLLTLNRFFLDDSQDCHILSEIPASAQIIPPVRIDPQVSVGQGAQIGPRVYLEAGCSIGQYAVISDAMVLQGAVVPARQRVAGTIVATQVRNPGLR